MAAWQLGLSVPEGDDALHVRIARAVADDIGRGRLSRGARLPGSRSLAESLGVHRNTVLAAYRELAGQGWIRTDRARGTFVEGPVEELPRAPAGATARRAPFHLASARDPRFGPAPAPLAGGSEGRDALLLSGGRPDPRLFPVELLARAYRRVLRRDGRRLLDYGDARGHAGLRTELAAMLCTRRGLAVGAEDLLVTRGSQMALSLVAGALLEPGDRVAVEAYGYPPAWAAFRAAGAEVVALPVDEEGLDVEALLSAHRAAPLRAVYVTPHHQYATGATLSAARRLSLLAFAAAERVALIEDDYDHEYHYDGKPVLPLASADRVGSVLYVGSLSKVLAPGLRIGYVAAAPAVIERLTRMRLRVDRQGDLPTEAALAELFEEGELQRHIWRTRRIYRARRDALVRALAERLGERVQVRVPAGGIAMWAHAPSLDVDRWAEACAERRVYFVPGRQIRFDGRASSHARLGFARHDEAELGEAVARMAEAAAAVARSGRRRRAQ